MTDNAKGSKIGKYQKGLFSFRMCANDEIP